jgi:hypothetical protein
MSKQRSMSELKKSDIKMIEHPDLSTINIEKIVCDNNLCKTALNNTILSR